MNKWKSSATFFEMDVNVKEHQRTFSKLLLIPYLSRIRAHQDHLDGRDNQAPHFNQFEALLIHLRQGKTKRHSSYQTSVKDTQQSSLTALKQSRTLKNYEPSGLVSYNPLVRFGTILSVSHLKLHSSSIPKQHIPHYFVRHL